MLQHVTLEVRPDQVRDCVRFWELLDFTELEPPPSLRGRVTWIGREGTQIHIQPVEQPAVPRNGHAAIVAAGIALVGGSCAALLLRNPEAAEAVEPVETVETVETVT